LAGLLARGVSPSQGLFLHRTVQHRKMRTWQVCLEWISNPWCQCSNGEEPFCRARGSCAQLALTISFGNTLLSGALACCRNRKQWDRALWRCRPVNSGGDQFEKASLNDYRTIKDSRVVCKIDSALKSRLQIPGSYPNRGFVSVAVLVVPWKFQDGTVKYSKRFPLESLPVYHSELPTIRRSVTSSADTLSWNNGMPILFTALDLSHDFMTSAVDTLS
jgi:hypothetical protein